MKNELSWNGSAFALKDYLGASVSISGSTTSGLQEWMNLCAANGMPGIATTCAAHPFVTSTVVTVPPSSLLDFEIIGGVVTSGIGVYSAFVFGSFSTSRFQHRGMIQYDGIGHPIQMIPLGGVSIDYSEIHFGTLDVAHSAGLAHCVHIDPTHGAINNNKISFRCINGAAKAQHGVFIVTPNTALAANSCFGQNDIDIGLITACVTCGVQEGNAGFVDQPLGTNKWEIGAITTGGNLGYGFITCGIGNLVRIGSISNNGPTTVGTGIYFGGGTYWNQVQITQNESTTKVLNQGASTNVVSP